MLQNYEYLLFSTGRLKKTESLAMTVSWGYYKYPLNCRMR